jgi:lysophospholipase L1-like esterase
VRFLALGDSYTIGEGVTPAERWPVQLAALLRADGLALAEPVILARTGWTTAELQAGLDAAAPAGPFDLVSLLIGVNNQYRGQTLDDYRVELGALLERAVGLAGGAPQRVLVLSIPDWGVTPFARGRGPAAIAAAIDAFNAVNRAAAEARGARYLDITPASRRAAAEPALIAADGLHPAGGLYAEWARLAQVEARAALERRNSVQDLRG